MVSILDYNSIQVLQADVRSGESPFFVQSSDMNLSTVVKSKFSLTFRYLVLP